MHQNNGSLQVQNDSTIWLAFKSGSELAFDYIYDTYFSKLYNYSLRFTPDTDLIKDCIQNLFVELWRRRENLADVESIKFYLYKCMRHRIIQEVIKTSKLVHEEALEENYSFEVSFSHEFYLITKQISEENQASLLKAFDLLTKRQKEAVFLRYYDNLEYHEIASIMQMKEVKYARTLIYRALDVLKASIRKLASVE